MMAHNECLFVFFVHYTQLNTEIIVKIMKMMQQISKKMKKNVHLLPHHLIFHWGFGVFLNLVLDPEPLSLG
jgi:hypothetical protein